MIAYTEKLGFDVLTTPIAELDRRTLSQAWFSALHLGKATQQNVAAPLQKKNSTFGQIRPHGASVDAPAGAHASVSVTRPMYIENGPGAAAASTQENIRVERRGPISVLARRIERALTDRQVHHGTFVLDGMEGRVHLSVRSQHGRIHIVAVCSPHAKAYVAQALNHVRFALSRKSIAFQGSLQTTHPAYPFTGGEIQ